MSSKKVSATLTYTSRGAQPPIFLAGSFSEPAWEPQEMICATDEDGECHFHKEVEVDEGGSYQYKFRIGVGDWWALNEQAPTVTDELGNRNNLLAVPIAQEIIQKSETLEPATVPPVSDMPIPEVVVEKVDGEPRHGDDFGPGATTGRKDAHDMRALDAEPDYVVIRSQTATPVYANTAAEVADSAAILDREPSPAPVSDEEAGRTGERRMSRTPIPEVALTAAEVADIAAILDQDEDGGYDNMRMNLPHVDNPYDTHSGPTTPWHERAPLFAHELVGTHDGDVESPITSESVDSATKPEPQEEIIDLNDPTIERFPEDRTSILTHIRSCESRMSEDETNIQGVPPSPITRAKSRSPSIDTPGSARLDAQPSPALDVITEEHQEDNYFGGLPGPVQNLQKMEEIRQPEELNVIREVEEPADDPKTVLDNLKKIEESTVDSGNSTVEPKFANPEADEIMPVEETRLAEDHDIIDEKKAKDKAGLMDSLNSDVMDNPLKSQPGPTSREIQPDLDTYKATKDRNSDVEKAYPLKETVSDASTHPTVHQSEPFKPGPHMVEHDREDSGGKQCQRYSHDGFNPEVQNDPIDDFKDHVALNQEQTEVERRHEVIQDLSIHEAKQHDEEQKEVSLHPFDVSPEVGPGPVSNQDEAAGNEDPDDAMNANVPAHGEAILEERNDHLQYMEVGQPPVTRQTLPELPQEADLQEGGNLMPKHDVISADEAVTKDMTAERMIEAQGVAEISTIQGSTAGHDVPEGGANQSAAALKTPNTELDHTHGNDIPESKTDDAFLATEHGKPKSESQLENASMDLDKSVVLDIREPVVGTSHEGELLVSQAMADKGPLSAEHNAMGWYSQAENASKKLAKPALFGTSDKIVETGQDEQSPVFNANAGGGPQCIEHVALGSDSQVENAATELEKSVTATGNLRAGLDTSDGAALAVLPVKTDEAPLTAEHEALGSSIQAENASKEAVVSATAFANPQIELDNTQGTHLPVQKKDADDSSINPDPQELGLAMAKLAIHVDQPSADVEPIHKGNLPVSQIKVDDPDWVLPAKQVLDSEIDKSSTVGGTQPEIETLRGADLPLRQPTLADAMLITSHVNSGKLDAHVADDVDSTLINGVDGAKPMSIDESSHNGYDSDSKLAPRKTDPPNIERQLTPDSMRSPMKASETENKKSIWQWLRGLIAGLCGGERGPLLAISAVVILGPLLAMYLSRSDVL